MTFYQTEQQEKVHLQQVISIINDTIHNTDTSVKEHVETLQEYKDYICSCPAGKSCCHLHGLPYFSIPQHHCLCRTGTNIEPNLIHIFTSHFP